MSTAVRLFISYSHVDESHRKRLETHLAPLQREGLITVWHDRMIPVGGVWAAEIDQNIEKAEVILLLVSADFIASDYCFQKEMAIALARHQRGEARVIPLFVEPADFTSMPFATIQGLPNDNRPVSTWANANEAWASIAKGIRAAIIDIAHARGAAKAGGVTEGRFSVFETKSLTQDKPTGSLPYRLVHTDKAGEHLIEELIPIDAYGGSGDAADNVESETNGVVATMYCPTARYLQSPIQMQTFTPISAVCLIRPREFVTTLEQRLTPVLGGVLSRAPSEMREEERIEVARTIGDGLTAGFIAAVAVPKHNLDIISSRAHVAYQKITSLFLIPLLSAHRRQGAIEIHVRISQPGERDKVLLRASKAAVGAAFGRRGSTDFVGGSGELWTTPLGHVARFAAWAVGRYYNSRDDRYLRALGARFDTNDRHSTAAY